MNISTLDSKFARLVSRVWDFVVLNICFIVSILPIITIGASVTALYSVLFKWIHKEEGYVWKDFFQAFKASFKKVTGLWLIFLGALVITIINLGISRSFPGRMSIALCTVFGLLLFILLATASYVFPIEALSDFSGINVTFNAFWMAFGCLPFTISVLVIEVLPFFLILIRPAWVQPIFTIMFFIGFSLQAYCCAVIFQYLQTKYLRN